MRALLRDAIVAAVQVLDAELFEHWPAWWSLRARVCEAARCPHCRQLADATRAPARLRV